MASTPSASALSAVLRCKTPPASAYRLGLSYGAMPSVPRAETPEEPKRGSSRWGSVLPEAPVDFPLVPSVSVRLESAKLRERKRQIKQPCNLPTRRDSGLSKATSCTSSETGRTATRVAHESRMPEADASESASRWGQVLGCLRLGDTLSVRVTFLSETGNVLCVGCKTDHTVSSVSQAVSHHDHHQIYLMLKTTLLQLTAFVSELVRTRLGAVRRKCPVDANKLTGCIKCSSDHGTKDKTKKGLKPGT
ncbi:uncharacterized protein LOC108432971 [Pygocentrus nattereri]|uniref:uncharacterized protein LOC108432971 n=1 Tax=Pygocentrus nattereri TaxID=42514 RepID=UPI0008144A9F|nr:uncharacterized protein LOC108432971 [Pygocentrus nattereri]